MYKKYIPLLFLYIALAVSVPGQNTLSNHRSGPGDSKSTNRLEPQLVSVLGNDHRSAADPLSRPRIAKPTSSAVRSSVVVNTTADERTAFNLINRVRSEHGLQPLVWNDEIAAISRIHSQNMADYNFFSHKGLDSKMVSDRADELGSRKWRAIGENIAFNRGFQDPVSKAVDLWLRSRSHRNNLLDPNWEESAIGIAVARDGSYYLTQVFWVRN